MLAEVTVDLSGFPMTADLNLGEFFLSNSATTSLSVRLDESAVAALHLHPRSYIKSVVLDRQTNYADVGLHLKGNYGTFQQIGGKPSLTLNFDKFVKGQKFHGLDKLHLNNSTSDPSYMTELICRELFRAAGLPAARVTHARVEINGRDAGLYVLVEGYNKSFLRRHFANPNGNLYDSEFMHDITYPLKSSSGGTKAGLAERVPPLSSEGRVPGVPDSKSSVASGVEGSRTKVGLAERVPPAGTKAGLVPPVDRSDLEALATAAEEPDHELRLARLGALLDLDRFYSFLALEMMMSHSDGYARAINNYWLYHEPGTSFAEGRRVPNPKAAPVEGEQGLAERVPPKASGKMVFIPHGMDQMFYQPQGSLFPALKGVVAQAVLETSEGRQQYRARCRTLFTSFFPALSNRVEEVRARLRPELAKLGPVAVAQHDRAVGELQQRIATRMAHLRQHLLAPLPGLLALAPGQSCPVTNWLFNLEQGLIIAHIFS